ncbi:RNI-like superfamily protein [Artemisia annua]|uniref:RNI-like superfamily protein n=1 Tax=Artemisia annua TaxID=35608 RepID=A0A2U1QMI3_ARTAN|nr:RNI-like superfamily protein [Artemisia annua]
MEDHRIVRAAGLRTDTNEDEECDVGHKRISNSCSITHLPSDALYLIFDKLKSCRDKRSFGLTCRTFLAIQNSSCKCLKLGCSMRSNCSKHAMLDETIIAEKLFKRFTQFQSLSLGTCLKVSDSRLTALLKYCSNLRSLYLDNSYHFTNVGLTSIASCCPLLSIISLSRCSIRDSGLEILAKSCKSLKEVNISGCIRITDCGIWSLIENCNQLRALNISGCDEIVGRSFQVFSSTLTCLEAKYCAFNFIAVGRILSGGGLEYLNLSSLRHKLFNWGPGLESIGLGFAANLKILVMQMGDFVDDHVIMEISKGCPLLQEWNLSRCNKVRIAGWESIGLNCKNLERLHVNECENLCDIGLLALGNGCKHLSMICMKNCGQVTTTGIQHFQSQRVGVEIKYTEMSNHVPSWAFTRLGTSFEEELKDGFATIKFRGIPSRVLIT